MLTNKILLLDSNSLEQMEANIVTKANKMAMKIIKLTMLLFYITAIVGTFVFGIISCYKVGEQINDIDDLVRNRFHYPSEDRMDRKTETTEKYKLYYQIGRSNILTSKMPKGGSDQISLVIKNLAKFLYQGVILTMKFDTSLITIKNWV